MPPGGGIRNRTADPAEETPTRSAGRGTDRPAHRCRSTSPAGLNPTSHRARQREVDGADSARSTTTMDEVHPRFERSSRVKVACPSSSRLRSPSRGRPGRSHDLPCLGSLPDPGARQAEAWVLLPPRIAEATRRPKPREGVSIIRCEQARTGIRTNGIGATTWVTRLSDEVDSVSGSQRPSMPPILYRTLLSADPRATRYARFWQERRVPPARLHEEGKEAEGDPGHARPPEGERAKRRSLWSLFLRARRTPERRALLRAHAAD